jgi:hypothetical protein
VHAPLTHAYGQTDDVCHAPFASHFCAVVPLQRVAPGVHEPAHAPFVHADAQGAPLCHLPFASHVCGTLPAH